MASLGKDGWGKGKARKARRGAEAPLLMGGALFFLLSDLLLFLALSSLSMIPSGIKGKRIFLDADTAIAAADNRNDPTGTPATSR
nr:hypothetical protein [uncultured Pseudomonas sp.]